MLVNTSSKRKMFTLREKKNENTNNVSSIFSKITIKELKVLKA